MKIFLHGLLCSIPAWVVLFPDPVLGIFMAPIVFVVTVVAALFLWILLLCMRFPLWARYTVLVAGLLGWSAYLGVSNHHEDTDEGSFEKLLIDPVPKSVRFIDRGGYISMAGGEEFMVFTIAANDFESVLKAQAFQYFNLSKDDAGPLDPSHIARTKNYGFEAAHASRSGEESSFLLLLTNERRTKVYLLNFSI